ncbi:MAG: WecB/TagA/CpsF family glycosyltransferase [Balneolaceae bacterium]|nr:WecB/TagA/CpsF family glycosyltransferase [Balneolaceae bacterium]
MNVENISLLGVNFAKLDIEQLNEVLEDIIQNGEQAIIANHNLHSVYLYHQLAEFRSFFKLADLVHADGMSLIYWGKLLGYDLDKKNRITYLDWIYPLLDIANRNKWKIFYLGGKKGVAKKAASKLQKKYTEITFGTHHGFFDIKKTGDSNILEEINDFHPNILMVGMGMPRQELWIKQNINSIESNIILPSGACFDYIAGEQKAPPRLWGRLGFELVLSFPV